MVKHISQTVALEITLTKDGIHIKFKMRWVRKLFTEQYTCI